MVMHYKHTNNNWDALFVLGDSPANTKHLYNIYTMLDQRQRLLPDVVLKLYKCFVFTGTGSIALC